MKKQNVTIENNDTRIADLRRDLSLIKVYVVVTVNKETKKATGVAGILVGRSHQEVLAVADQIDSKYYPNEELRAFETEIAFLDPFAKKMIDREVVAVNKMLGTTNATPTDLFAFNCLENIKARAKQQSEKAVKRTRTRLRDLNRLIDDLKSATSLPAEKELTKVAPTSIRNNAAFKKKLQKEDEEGVALPKSSLTIFTTRESRSSQKSKRARKA